MNICIKCETKRALIRKRDIGLLCKECFSDAFEEEIHQTIVETGMFNNTNKKVAIGASGGKDSTVLIHVITKLNKKHNYNIEPFLLSIDEGIAGYRNDSLKTVKTNSETYGLPLKVLSYKELYGWTMDEIVSKTGTKRSCTFCGVFRRQSLNKGAEQLDVGILLTGHNADDIAETLLLNFIRGDIKRIYSCGSTITSDNFDYPIIIPRAKPFKKTTEKEIVMYSYLHKLIYFTTECTYSVDSSRGFARTILRKLEKNSPNVAIDTVYSAESIQKKNKEVSYSKCIICGSSCIRNKCNVCVLLEEIEK